MKCTTACLIQFVLGFLAAALQAEAAGKANIDELIEAVESTDVERQKDAIVKLGQLDKEAQPAAASLIKLLESPNPQLKVRAAWALTRIQPETQGLEAVLCGAIRSTDSEQRGVAIAALSGYPPLHSDPTGVAGFQPREPESIAALADALADSNSDTAEWAALGLGRLGERAIPHLLPRLDSDNANVRKLAVFALGMIGPSAVTAVPKLIALLEDSNVRVREAAAKALGSFPAEREKIAPTLFEALQRHGGNFVSTTAAESLGRFGPEMIPRLLETMRDERSPARYAAGWAFRAMGPVAVPALVAAMCDPAPGVRNGAVWGLDRMGPAAMPELTRLLRSEEIELRCNAARAVAHFGRADAATTEALIEALKTPDDGLRQAALFALAQVRAKEAVAPIREALDDKSPHVRFEAQQALRILEGGAADTMRREGPPGEIARFAGHTDKLAAVIFFPDGRRILSAGHDATVWVWDQTTGAEVRRFTTQGSIQAAALSADGRRIACGGVFGKAHLFVANSGTTLQQFDHGGWIDQIVFDSSRGRLLSYGSTREGGGIGRMVRTWDIASGNQLPPLRLFAPGLSPAGACLAENGRRIFCAYTPVDPTTAPADAFWQIQDVETGEVLLKKTLPGREGTYFAIFSPDARQLLLERTIGEDGLSLWDIDAGKEIGRLPNPSAACGSAISADGRRALVGRSTGRIDLYDLQQGRIMASYDTQAGWITSAAFSPDGRHAVTGGVDRLVRLWRLPE
ncbi:MAG: hypothetical protein GXY83_29060 [Rhodopirellula sp.]|nr:hypothetical protein [Rhodopirellula sp.]